MPPPLFTEMPVLPNLAYADISEIPRSGFKAVEVEAVSVALDVSARAFHTRLIASPEDGPLEMCSVYLRSKAGGAICIGDFATKEQALGYAKAVGDARRLPVTGGIFDLRAREVPGGGYIAHPRAGRTVTRDPAKAALYHRSIAKEELFAGALGERGHWCSWFSAAQFSLSRATDSLAMMERVYTAVRAAMGASAPATGSSDESLLRSRLRSAVEEARSDRLVVFAPAMRAYLIERLIEAKHELQGTETDEEICARLVQSYGAALFDGVDPAFEDELLDALSGDAGAEALKAAAAQMPGDMADGMVLEIHQRLAGRGDESPFSAMVDVPGAVESGPVC